MNDLARQIKERVTARQVAELYGFHPDRGGFIQCPFHAGDNHGSLKLYDGSRGWHCFGCGAGGDVITFVMKIFSINFQQACLRINADFCLGLSGEPPSRAERSALLEARRREEERQEAREAQYRAVAREYQYLHDAARYFAPEGPAAASDLHPLYVEALKRQPALESWLDEHLGR